MSWLDDLEKIKDEPAYNQRGIMPVGLDRETLNRLISIVQRAEWSNWGTQTRRCFICDKLPSEGHAKLCEYHPDWRKND